MKLITLKLAAIMWIAVLLGCTNSPKKETIQNYYKEEYRPQFHFSPAENWMNDPNGMFFYEGEYHLFYQYYPDSTVWGPMHWGHAVSTDMVHWTHLPVALAPDEHGYIYSGSAVVDWKNTSGLGKNDQPPLIAIFTYHDPVKEREGKINFESQGLAYSNDKGRTWTKYGNPVLGNPGIRDFRDPKVIWYEAAGKWIMTLAVKDHVAFYSSSNLIDWKKESEFGKGVGAHGGIWECPDLFPLEDKETGTKKWILSVSINPGGPNGGSATQYFVGDFNGNTFSTPQSQERWMDYGRDNYAGVTWSDMPKQDGRRVVLGWMSNWSYAELVPTEKWRSATTIPRELVLKNTDNGYLVTSVPIAELKKIRKEKIELPSQVVSGNVPLNLSEVSPMQAEMAFNFQLKRNSQFGIPEEFGLVFSNDEEEEFRIGYSISEKYFFTDRTHGGKSSFFERFAGKSVAAYDMDDKMQIRVFADKASVEVFVDGGKLVFTDIVFPTTPYDKVTLFSHNGSIKLNESVVWSLSSVW